MLNAKTKFLKFILIVMNLAIVRNGIILLETGIWSLAHQSLMEGTLGSLQYMNSVAILIASGVIMILSPILGCLGTIKEARSLLLIHFIILLLTFLVILLGGTIGYFVIKDMYIRMVSSVSLYHNGTSIADTWDTLQTVFECCGVLTESIETGWEVWSKLNSREFYDKKVPPSCCVVSNFSDDCLLNPNEDTVYMEDCYTEAESFVSDNALTLGNTTIETLSVLGVGMALTGALYIVVKRMRSQQLTSGMQCDQVVPCLHTTDTCQQQSPSPVIDIWTRSISTDIWTRSASTEISMHRTSSTSYEGCSSNVVTSSTSYGGRSSNVVTSSTSYGGRSSNVVTS